MLKTMYEQFIIGEHSKVVDFGLITKDIHYNMRYYIYANKVKSKIMTIYFTSDLAFSPNDLPNLIACNMIKIELIEFKEI
jgi:hypothetical protein